MTGLFFDAAALKQLTPPAVLPCREIIASACNRREKNIDISAHAEILAIKEASTVLNNWRLDDCELYVTLEPCPMCAWAIIQSRIKNRIVSLFVQDVVGIYDIEEKKISNLEANEKVSFICYTTVEGKEELCVVLNYENMLKELNLLS
jgi:tRNA(Arg) A34 adenosine deaminase TadA